MNRRELLAGGVTLMAAATAARGAARLPTTAAQPQVPSSGESCRSSALAPPVRSRSALRRRARPAARRCWRRFFAAGARLIDTSPMYSTAEAVLGDLLTPPMHAAGLHRHQGVDARARRPASSRCSAPRSCCTQRIDLMQVHNLLDLDAHLNTLRAGRRRARCATSASRTTP